MVFESLFLSECVSVMECYGMYGMVAGGMEVMQDLGRSYGKVKTIQLRVS